jgi:GNAT superfamily N-acetyltransferase
VGTVGRVPRGNDAIEVADVDPDDMDAQHCLRAYFAELDRRFDIGFDPSATLPLDPDEMRPPAGTFVVATVDGAAVGCGGLKLRDGGTWAEVKRMWVSPAARGTGLGRRLLAELEARASAAGCSVVRLDTNGSLTEAIALYRSSGYVEVDDFNGEPYATLWFEKPLLPTGPRSSPSPARRASQDPDPRA